MSGRVRKVLIVGSGPIKIAEAAEFDYSANQALKALREEGIETVILSSNIATIQTDISSADKVYVLPVTYKFAESVIRKEKPEGIMIGFGGQSALNVGVDLAKKGLLEKYNVKLLGTPIDGIETALSRKRFKETMVAHNLPIPPGGAVRSYEEAKRVASEIGYPVMIRVSFNLGGRGSYIAKSEKALEKNFKRAIAQSRTGEVLIEKYLKGWKEVEYEVVRDIDGNSIAVACLENIDPMGVHTGDSIVVAPAQTLDNNEYQAMRSAAIKVAEAIGLVGECNVQFALDPKSSKFYIIETNPRLSRSSALASKATGYPLAYISAKLALGKRLYELKNNISNATSAFFEPSLDYIVIKMPRWDLKKFEIDRNLSTEMMSTGEVMAIGRNIEEAFAKGINMLGLRHVVDKAAKDMIGKGKALNDLKKKRLYWFIDVIRAYANGASISEINRATDIDPFFSEKIVHLTKNEKNGAKLFVKQIDTLAGEYPANLNYLYTTRVANEDDISFKNKKKKMLVLGAGGFRIGVSVEFDYTAVLLAKAARKGFEVSILNFNPETVSTDWDIADKLYFDDIEEELIEELNKKEKFDYIATFAAGQKSNDIASKLESRNIKLLGSNAKSIELAENRKEFSKLLSKLDIPQPEWISAESIEDIRRFIDANGFPVLVRPSHVLSGTSMRIANNYRELISFIKDIPHFSKSYPVVISKFLTDSVEAEIDAVADDENAIGVVIKHVEEAGVHSGDSTMVIPVNEPYAKQMKEIALKLVREMHIKGPFNLQFVVNNGKAYVIELNLRASRSLPFSSKALGMNLVAKALQGSLGKFGIKGFYEPHAKRFAVKSPQFSWLQMRGAYPELGPEMKSTGESGGFGKNFEEALLKSWLGAQPNRMPNDTILIYGPKSVALENAAREFSKSFDVITVKGDYAVNANELEFDKCLDLLNQNSIDLLVTDKSIKSYDFPLRRTAADLNIPLVLNANLGYALAKAMQKYKSDDELAESID
jgi:carbamoyl-phosphate synthase large subunit